MKGLHGVEVAVIVPLSNFYKTVINQIVRFFDKSAGRAFCMNGHRASCILHFAQSMGECAG